MASKQLLMQVLFVLFPSHRITMSLVMVVCCLIAEAQSRCVVIDKETGIPIRDVKVYTDKGHVFVSDYQGRVVVDSAFKSVTFSHVSYLMRVLERHEWRDTLWLLPKENRLGEVVVWGTEHKKINQVVGLATRDAASYAPPPGLASFDFFEMFRKKPLSKKARKKNKELLRDWDKVYDNPPMGATPHSPDSTTVK